MIAAKIYPITLAAGASFRLQAGGDYFKVLSATGTVEVQGDTFGTVGELQAGQGLDGVKFGALTLRDTSGAENDVKIVVAGDNFVDDRVTGEVSVIDGGRARTLAGQVFGGRIAVTGVAGVIAQAQWWNPVGSGKRMIVGSYNAQTGGTSGAVVGYAATQLPKIAITSANAKMPGFPLSVIEQRYDDTAAAGPATMRHLGHVTSGEKMRDPEPFVIPPGYGLTLISLDVASTLMAGIHFIEESL